MTQDSPLLFARRGALAIATLNQPKALNALSLEMIELLHGRLREWAEDESVACVWIDGSGDRGLCAGGDVVSLYREASGYGGNEGDPPQNEYATRFFSTEYRLDYAIHTYCKPIVVWGGGIVMGGGIGILAGASHRVVTESTRMAMPEVTIGLFPDVGGSWFLNRMPGRLGLFLGLTGAQFNGADAVFAGLADRILADADRERAQAALAELKYTGMADADRALVSGCLKALEIPADARGAGNLRAHFDAIQELTDCGTLPQVCAAIAGYTGEDPWLKKAATTLAGGCPLTPWVVWEQLRRGRHLSLAGVFRMELALAVNMVSSGHFREGVRALLIDKDRNPRWQPRTVEQVSSDMVERILTPPWAENPLSDL